MGGSFSAAELDFTGMQFNQQQLKKATGYDTISKVNSDDFLFHLDSQNLMRLYISYTDPYYALFGSSMLNFAFTHVLELLHIDPNSYIIQILGCGFGSGLAMYVTNMYIPVNWVVNTAGVLGFTAAKISLFGTDDIKFTIGEMLFVNLTFVATGITCYVSGFKADTSGYIGIASALVVFGLIERLRLNQCFRYLFLDEGVPPQDDTSIYSENGGPILTPYEKFRLCEECGGQDLVYKPTELHVIYNSLNQATNGGFSKVANPVVGALNWTWSGITNIF
jgi:hypothetical protein